MGRSAESKPGVVVVGASAGGVEALQQMVAGLPADLPAAVCIVLHLPPRAESALPQILSRAGALPARHASDGEQLVPGHIYVAPPDQHLLIADGRVKLVRGPREHSHRPAIDPLFASAALAHGSRVIGVILSGTLDDGSAGMRAVAAAGGVGIVQDPQHALYGDMPRNAIRADSPRHVMPAEEIGAVVMRLVLEQRSQPEQEMEEAEAEVRYAEVDLKTVEEEDVPGDVVPLSCPECGGTLWALQERDRVQFRCRVGHAYGAESLDQAQEEALETALWAALRALEERAALSLRLAARMRDNAALARQRARYEERARLAQRDARRIREVLLGAASRESGEAAS